MPDLADGSTAAFRTPEFGEAFDFTELSFLDVIQALRTGIDFLDRALEEQSFYTQTIPVINQSLEESFGFVDEFLAKVELAAENPQAAIQAVEAAIESAFGISDDNTLDPYAQKFALTLDSANQVLNVHTNWGAVFADQFLFELDLGDLFDLVGVDLGGLAGLEGFLDAGANLDLAAMVDLVADIGIDYSGLGDGGYIDDDDIFLYGYDTDFRPDLGETVAGTHLDLGARLYGEDLNLAFDFGPIEVGVMGGYAVLDRDGDIGTKPTESDDQYAKLTLYLEDDDGDRRLALAEAMDHVSHSLEGAFDIHLPLNASLMGIEHTFDTLEIRTLDPGDGRDPLDVIFNAFLDGNTGAAHDVIYISEPPDVRGMFESLGGQFSLMSILNDPSFILDGVDLALGGVEEVLDSSLAHDLPLIGDKLAGAASFIHDMRVGVLGDLRAKLSGNGKTIEVIRDTLFDVFGPEGDLDILLDYDASGTVTVDDIQVGWYDIDGGFIESWEVGDPVPRDAQDREADAIQFDMDLGGTVWSDGYDIPLDFEIPGLALEINGGLGLEVGWSFDFGLGISVTDGLYLTTNSDDDPEIEIGISAFLDGAPLDPNVRTRFTAEGKLLFFKATVTDTDRDDDRPGFQPGGVFGGLIIDMKGDEKGRLTVDRLFGSFGDVFDIDFGVDAEIDLDITLELDGAKGVPTLRADLELDWEWKPGKENDFDIDLRNVRLDVGSFVRDFLKPIVDNVAGVLEPIEPVVAVLTQELPGFKAILKKDPNLMGLINLTRELYGKKPIDWSFVYAVRDFGALVNTVNGMLTSDGEILLGDIAGLGNPRNLAGYADPIDWDDYPTITRIEGVHKKSNDLYQPFLDPDGNLFDPPSGEMPMMRFDYLFSLDSWIKLLTGKNATLFTLDLPQLIAGMDFYKTLVTFPLGPVIFDVSAFGGFEVGMDLGFGYDTYGIRKALDTGNASDAFDGFFVMDGPIDAKGNWTDTPEVFLNASIGLAAAVNIVVIEAGLEGSLQFEADIDLQDIAVPTVIRDPHGNIIGQEWESDGKIRVSEMVTMWEYQNGGFANLFNLDSELSLLLGAFVDVGIKIPFVGKVMKRIINITLADITLAKFDYNAPYVQPELATQSGGTLTVHTGSRAGDRQYLDTEDGNEQVELIGDGNSLMVLYNDWYQVYHGVTHVIADGGAGDDTFDASKTTGITVDFSGGAGEDRLITGTGGGVLLGGDAKDVLDASRALGAVTIRGGRGDDRITGGHANDDLDGGAGDDRIAAGTGDDTITGGTGLDTIQGGQGNDTYKFSDAYGVDRFRDRKDIETLDFSGVTGDLTVTLSRAGVSALLPPDSNGISSEVKAQRADVDHIILGTGNDHVIINDFPEGPVTITDTGGDDVYDVKLGRAGSPKAIGTIHIDDRAGRYDEIILEQKNHRTPIELNTYQVINGREVLNFDAGIEYETLKGTGALFHGPVVESYGSQVSWTNTNNGGISELGDVNFRVIAESALVLSETRAPNMTFEISDTLNVDANLRVDEFIDITTAQYLDFDGALIDAPSMDWNVLENIDLNGNVHSVGMFIVRPGAESLDFTGSLIDARNMNWDIDDIELHGDIHVSGSFDLRTGTLTSDARFDLFDANWHVTDSDLNLFDEFNVISNGTADILVSGVNADTNLYADIRISSGDNADGVGSGAVHLVTVDGNLRTDDTHFFGTEALFALSARGFTDTIRSTTGRMTLSTTGSGEFAHIHVLETDALTVVGEDLTVDSATDVTGFWSTYGDIRVDIIGYNQRLTLKSGSIVTHSADGDIVLVADDFDFLSGPDQIIGRGELSIRATREVWNYYLGTAAEDIFGADIDEAVHTDHPDAVDLVLRDLAAIADGFALIRIGRDNAGNTMVFGDALESFAVKKTGVERYVDASFRDDAIFYTDHLEIRGDVQAPIDRLEFYANTVSINSRNLHNPDGLPDSGVTADTVLFDVIEQMIVGGWVRGTDAVDINVHSTDGVGALSIFGNGPEGANSLKTDIGSEIEVANPGGKIHVDAIGSVKVAGLIEAHGDGSVVDIDAGTAFTLLEGGLVAARDEEARIDIVAETDIVTIEAGSAIVAGARWVYTVTDGEGIVIGDALERLDGAIVEIHGQRAFYLDSYVAGNKIITPDGAIEPDGELKQLVGNILLVEGQPLAMVGEEVFDQAGKSVRLELSGEAGERRITVVAEEGESDDGAAADRPLARIRQQFIGEGAGADATVTAAFEMLMKGVITTSGEMTLTADAPLYHYNEDYFSKIPPNGDEPHYLAGHDQFSLLMTGTLTTLGDDSTLVIRMPEDIIIRGNIDVAGENSDLLIQSEEWIYHEGFIEVQDSIRMLAGADAVGWGEWSEPQQADAKADPGADVGVRKLTPTYNDANDDGMSLYVHVTSRINTFQEASSIVLSGARDVNVHGAVVAGGEIGANGVTWVGSDSTATVSAGEKLYLDTGILASKSVAVSGGEAGLDDDDLSVIIDTAGGLYAAGLTADGSGGHIEVTATDDLEIMGHVVSGANVTFIRDEEGVITGKDYDWSAEASDVLITAGGQAFIGGTTTNKQGERVQTGGYVRANERVHIIGGEDESGTGVFIQGASEVVTENADSVIEINATFDADIQGVVLAGGDVLVHRAPESADSESTLLTYMGRKLIGYGGESTITVTADHQIRVGTELRAGKAITLTGGEDPVEPDPVGAIHESPLQINHSGKGMVLYGSARVNTWSENSTIDLNGIGRIDVLAPAYTNEILSDGWIETADGKLADSVTLAVWLDKVDTKISAQVTLDFHTTLDNDGIEDLMADIRRAIGNAVWIDQDNRLYEGFAAPVDGTGDELGEEPFTSNADLDVKLYNGKLLFVSPYAFQLLASSGNAGLLGLDFAAGAKHSSLPYAVDAPILGSSITIGSPTGPNDKLYIAGKVRAHDAIYMHSGVSDDGIDIDLDWTGVLETLNGSMEINPGVNGYIKGDIIARGLGPDGTGSDVVIHSEYTLTIAGDIDAYDSVNISAGTVLAEGEASVTIEATSDIRSTGGMGTSEIVVSGHNDVIIDGHLGTGSTDLYRLAAVAEQGDLVVTHESGWIETDAYLELQGRDVVMDGVIDATGITPDADDWEVRVDAGRNVVITGDMNFAGSTDIHAGEHIAVFDAGIEVTGQKEQLSLRSDGTMKLGEMPAGSAARRSGSLDNPSTMQGAIIAAPDTITLTAVGDMEVTSAVVLSTTEDQSAIAINSGNLNFTGAAYAGGRYQDGEGEAPAEPKTITYTGRESDIRITATGQIILGGEYIDGAGQPAAMGGALRATGEIRISDGWLGTSEASPQEPNVGNDVALWISRESSLQTDATGQFDNDTGSFAINTVAESAITATLQGGIRLFGQIQALDDGADVDMSTDGLFYLDGAIRADDRVHLTGGASDVVLGTNTDQLGLWLTPILLARDAHGNYLDEEGRAIDADGFLIDTGGNHVDVDGNPLPDGADPLLGAPNQRISGGLVDTGPAGTILLDATADVWLYGMVGKVFTTEDGVPWVNTESVHVSASDGAVAVTNLVNATREITIAARDIGVLEDAVVKTRAADSEIVLRADEEIFIERSPYGTTARALVESSDRVLMRGESIQIDGTVRAVDTGGQVLGYGARQVTVTGSVEARAESGQIALFAGISMEATRAELETAGFTKADMTGGAINILGTGALEAGDIVDLIAGGDVRISAFSNLADDQIAITDPYLTQDPQTIQVVTGSRQVADGFITVPEVHWTTTTVTEQVGMEDVKAGDRFYTMDVTLTQDGYYNPDANNGTGEIREYFVENVDYYNDNSVPDGPVDSSIPIINWAAHGVVAPTNSDDTFNELNDDQRNAVLATLGYYKLYNLGYVNLTEHGSINGIPYDLAQGEAGFVAPDWLDDPIQIRRGTVDGWQDKFIRVPKGLEDDVLRVVSQGEPETWNETVGQYRDRAKVLYTQDKSYLTSEYHNTWRKIDFDNSIARWNVDYDSTGQRQYRLYNDAGGADRWGDFGREPDWVYNDEYVGRDDNNRYVLAPYGYITSMENGTPAGYISDTDTIHNQQLEETHYRVHVGYHQTLHAREYEYISTDRTWSEARGAAWNRAAQRGWGGRASYLVCISGSTENQIVANKAGGSGAWIGGYRAVNDKNTWAWVNGSSFTYSSWHSGQPDNYDKKEDYIQINWSGLGKWNDWVSGGSLGYVVEFDPWWERDDELYENQHDYYYQWDSTWTDVTDKRLTLNYQWVSQADPIWDQRPKFETYETQLKVVEEKKLTQWRTDLVYGEQTVFTTERVYEENPVLFGYGEFQADSIRAGNGIRIASGNDVAIKSRLEAWGEDGVIEINADGDVVVAGLLPAGADGASTLAATAELKAGAGIDITAGGVLTVAGSGRLVVDNGLKDATLESGGPRADDASGGNVGEATPGTTVLQNGIITLEAAADVTLAGTLFSSSEITVLTAGDMDLAKGKLTAGDTLSLTAGADGAGSVTGDIRTELLTLNAGGAMTLIAGWLGTSGASPQQGETSPQAFPDSIISGDILLSGSLLAATSPEGSDTASSITLHAAGGLITHTGGRIRADQLTARAAFGLTANTDTRRIDAVVSGAGDVAISNVGAVDLARLHAFDGKITVEAFGAMTATDVAILTDRDGNDIDLTTRRVYLPDEVGGMVARGEGNLVVGTVFVRGEDATLESGAPGEDATSPSGAPGEDAALQGGLFGDVILHVDGDIYQLAGEAGITADGLAVRAAGGITLNTDVATLDLRTLATGAVAMDQSASTRTLTLESFRVADGAISIDTGGDLVAAVIDSESNRQGNDIALAAGGDVAVDVVGGAGFAATAGDADALRLRNLNTLLRAAGVLPDWERDWTITRARALAAILGQPGFSALADGYRIEECGGEQAAGSRPSDGSADGSADGSEDGSADGGCASLIHPTAPDKARALAIYTKVRSVLEGLLTDDAAHAEAVSILTGVAAAGPKGEAISHDVAGALQSFNDALREAGVLLLWQDDWGVEEAGGLAAALESLDLAALDRDYRAGVLTTAVADALYVHAAVRQEMGAMGAAGGADPEDTETADAEALAILTLSGTLASHTDLVINAGGAIREMAGFDDAEVDLVARNAILSAGTGVVDLEVAFDELTSATTVTGGIAIRDFDGAGAQVTGLDIGRITEADEAVGGMSAPGDVLVDVEGDLGVLNIRATGADADVSLTARAGNVVVLDNKTEAASLFAGSETVLTAGGSITLEDEVRGSERLAFLADGGPFRVAGASNAARPVLDSNVVSIASTGSITVGEIRARDSVTLSAGTNVTLQGDIGGREGGQLADLFLSAAGEGTIRVNVPDEESGMAVYHDADGARYLRDVSASERYHEGDGNVGDGRFFTETVIVDGREMYVFDTELVVVDTEEFPPDVFPDGKNSLGESVGRLAARTWYSPDKFYTKGSGVPLYYADGTQVSEAEIAASTDIVRVLAEVSDRVTADPDDPDGRKLVTIDQRIEATGIIEFERVQASAEDSLTLHAARAILGDAVALDLGGPEGVIDISTGQGIRVDEDSHLILTGPGGAEVDISLSTAAPSSDEPTGFTPIGAQPEGVPLVADGAVRLTTTGFESDIRVSGGLAGHGGATGEIVLTSSHDIVIDETAELLASDLIRLDAANQLQGNLSLTATGQDGEIELVSGGAFALGDAVLTADGRIALEAGDALSLDSANLQGLSGDAPREVSLVAGDVLTVAGGAVAAIDRIEMRAAGALIADLNLTASGSEGAIVLAAESLDLTTASLTATRRIGIEAVGDIVIKEGNLQGADGALEEVSLVAGRNLTVGGIITADRLIRLRAETGTLDAALRLVSDQIDIKSGEALALTEGTVLSAATRIAVESLGNMTVASGALRAADADGLTDLSLISGGDLDLGGAALAASELVLLHAAGALRNADLNLSVAGVEGMIDIASGASLELIDVTMRAGQAIALATGGGMRIADSTLTTLGADGGIALTATGGAIVDPDILLVDGVVVDTGTSLIEADALTARARDGVYLQADAREAAIAVTDSGDIALKVLDDVELDGLVAQDGAIHVESGGTVVVRDVRSLTDADGNNIRIDNSGGTGNMLVGHVAVGAASGRIYLESSALIREIDGYDSAMDVSGFYALLKTNPGTGRITNHEDPNLEIEIDAQDVILLESDDLIIDEVRDVEIDTEVSGTAHIKTLGRATIKNLTSGAGDITIEAMDDVTIGYVDAGFGGTLTVVTGGSIHEFSPDDLIDLVAGELVFSAGRDIGSLVEPDRILETQVGGEVSLLAGNDVALHQHGDLCVEKAVATGGALQLVSEGRLVIGNEGRIWSGGKVLLTAGAAVSVAGYIGGTGLVVITGTGIRVDGFITSHTDWVRLRDGNFGLIITGIVRPMASASAIDPPIAITGSLDAPAVTALSPVSITKSSDASDAVIMFGEDERIYGAIAGGHGVRKTADSPLSVAGDIPLGFIDSGKAEPAEPTNSVTAARQPITGEAPVAGDGDGLPDAVDGAVAADGVANGMTNSTELANPVTVTGEDRAKTEEDDNATAIDTILDGVTSLLFSLSLYDAARTSSAASGRAGSTVGVTKAGRVRKNILQSGNARLAGWGNGDGDVLLGGHGGGGLRNRGWGRVVEGGGNHEHIAIRRDIPCHADTNPEFFKITKCRMEPPLSACVVARTGIGEATNGTFGIRGGAREAPAKFEETRPLPEGWIRADGADPVGEGLIAWQ